MYNTSTTFEIHGENLNFPQGRRRTRKIFGRRKREREDALEEVVKMQEENDNIDDIE